MEDILLAIMMLAIFAFGYFVVDHFGKFMDENFRGYWEPQKPSRKVYIAETEGKGVKAISQEVNSMPDALPDDEEYEIIICKSLDPHIIEHLEASGYTIKYDLRQ